MKLTQSSLIHPPSHMGSLGSIVKQKKGMPRSWCIKWFCRIFRLYYLMIAYCAVAIFMIYVFGDHAFLEAIIPYAISGFQTMTELMICVSITTAIHESSR
jgi:hypothetical protein